MRPLVLGLMLVTVVVGPPVLGFAQSTTKDPTGTKVEPKGVKVEPKGVKAEPKGAKAEPKGAKVEDVAVNGDGNAIKDSWLTTKTAVKLFADNRVKAGRIGVDTHAGIVTLRGTVETLEQRGVAEGIAKSVGGVRSVSSALQVVHVEHRRLSEALDADILAAGKTRLANDDQLRDADVKLRVDAGLLTLQGTVADGRAKGRAAEIARGIPGVRVVRNELRPKG